MMSHPIAFRNPGPPDDDWTETLEWPESLRVPVAGEMVDLPTRGQFTVQSVQWFCHLHHGGRPLVQVIVR